MDRRKFLKGMGLGTAAGAAAVNGFPHVWVKGSTAMAATGDIPVGVLFSQTGAVAVVESTLHDACMMAIDEINASGGVNGRMLKPFVEDG
jgi:urea transport system substrate-binding protein